MNYKKLILVGVISAFVAVLTSIMGVAGTIIGSVISSVLYNMLTEALDKPVDRATFSTNFEWDIAYVFPIAVIALIQLLLIFALLAEAGVFPSTFISVYLSLQQLADNNLYRLLGVALLVISAYPLILKPDFVKKEHGVILVFVALIFLARGFVDMGNRLTDIYDDVFIMFDLPIAIIAFILLAFVIIRILMSAKHSENESKTIRHDSNRNFERESTRVHHSRRHGDFDYVDKRTIRVKNHRKDTSGFQKQSKINFKGSLDKKPAENNDVADNQSHSINKSSGNIQFESNDLLDDYKK
ncbi:hypothetical protein [Methanobrevibacter sp.]|uniref:hypothetical protein n=1 Tax=Methanobrevibacter sp. TaxID=66852 RepID=UPI00388F8216